MKLLLAALILLLSACAPYEAIKHGELPQTGCIMLPKASVHQQDMRQFEVVFEVRCVIPN